MLSILYRCFSDHGLSFVITPFLSIQSRIHG